MKFKAKLQKFGKEYGVWVPEAVVRKLGIRDGEERVCEITKG